MELETSGLMQGSDFVAKAVDIAVNELLAIATPGQGNWSFRNSSVWFSSEASS